MTVHVTLTTQNKKGAETILQKLGDVMGENRSLSLSASDKVLLQDLADLRNRAIHLGFEISWDLPVPYSDLNPVALEMDPAFEPVRGAGNAWLYVEPDG